MPSLVLGSGADMLKIEGEALSFQKLSTQVGTQEAPIVMWGIPEGPADDIRISDLPMALRELASYVAQASVVVTEYKLPPSSWVIVRREINAWLPLGQTDSIDERTLIGYTIDSRHIKLFGLIPLAEPGVVGQEVVVNSWVLAQYVSEHVGLILPRRYKRA